MTPGSSQPERPASVATDNTAAKSLARDPAVTTGTTEMELGKMLAGFVRQS